MRDFLEPLLEGAVSLSHLRNQQEQSELHTAGVANIAQTYVCKHS